MFHGYSIYFFKNIMINQSASVHYTCETSVIEPKDKLHTQVTHPGRKYSLLELYGCSLIIKMELV